MNWPPGVPKKYLDRLPLPKPFLNHPKEVVEINRLARRRDKTWPSNRTIVGANSAGDYWYYDRSERLLLYDQESGESFHCGYPFS